MPLTLVKGQNTALDPGLTEVMVGLGWDERVDNGDDFDLDASAFLLDKFRKVRSDDDFIFYNQLASKCGSVVHQGDNLTGGDSEGLGDSEQVKVCLNKVPEDVERIVFAVSIYQAEERKQNFGMVDNAYIRVVDSVKNVEIARFDLTEDACIDRSILFGEIYRHNGVWKFKALGQGFEYDLGAIARNYGVQV